jgi:ATP-binding cassette subfamily C protein
VVQQAGRDLWGGMALCLLLTLFIDVAILVVPIFDMQLYDRVLQSRNMDTVLLLSVACSSGLAIYGILDLLRSAALLAIAETLGRRLRAPLLRHAVGLGLAGDATAAAQTVRDIEALRGFMASGAVCVPLDALVAPLLLAVLFMLHPAFGWLALLSASTLVLIGALTDVLGRPALLAATAQQQRVAGELAQHFRNAEISEALGMRAAITRRWTTHHDDALAGLRHAQHLGHKLEGVSKFARVLMAAGVMVMGAVLILAHFVTPGALMGANLLLNKMLGPFDHLLASWRQWVLALAAWRRIRRLDLAPSPTTSTEAPTERARGLALHNVSFRLAGTSRELLHDLTFSVPPGAALAVVGPNGAGKSTLLRLLAGLLQPATGCILLDGAPLLPGGHIGYLPQGVALLGGTIGANIARFATAAAEHDGPLQGATIVAARQAGVHDLIGRLRLGYDTELHGEGGGLSGGQSQRVALARALFGAPRLLILDEPDASLDHDGDIALLAALNDARVQGSVVVLTTHRPKLLEAMDLVLEIEGGSMQAFGPRGAPPATAAAAPPAPAPATARMQPA